MELPSTVAANYKNVSLVAAGNFGAVFYGEEKRTGRAVALKMSLRKYEDEEESFVREVNMLKKVQRFCGRHLSCYEADYPKYHIVVTDFVRGVTLEEFVRARMNRDTYDATILMMRQLFPVLGMLHANGIAHTDITTANIMANTESGVFVLIDFGLSCVRESRHTKEKYLQCSQKGYNVDLGNRNFVSPRIVQALDFNKEPITFDVMVAKDDWAVASCAFYLLTHSLPFGHLVIEEHKTFYMDEDAPTNALQTYAQTHGRFDDVVVRIIYDMVFKDESIAEVLEKYAFFFR